MTKDKTSKQANIKFTVIVIGLLLVIAALVVGELYVWAKYRTAVNGTATGQVAAWSFKVNGSSETTGNIDLAVTRTDGNTHIASGKIAPGTSGQIPITIDARGTETYVEYVVDIAIANKPRNLKFYSDSAMTQELDVTNEIRRRGFMNLTDVESTKSETIYWNWPFETGDTDAKKKANNKIDTEDKNNTPMTFQISVLGEEVMQQTAYLADSVHIGDIVNYNAASGNGAGLSYTTNEAITGSATQSTFSSNDTMQWKVLEVDNATKEVKLMAVTPSSLTMEFVQGYNNSLEILNNIASKYGEGNCAKSARSIKIEDINKNTTYDVTDFVNADQYSYGSTESLWVSSQLQYFPIVIEGAEIGAVNDLVIPNGAQRYALPQTYYGKGGTPIYSLTEYAKNSSVANVLKMANYWVASHYCNLHPTYCGIGVRSVDDGMVDSHSLFTPQMGHYNYGLPVAPIVTLKWNTKVTGGNGTSGWEIGE